MILQIFSKKSVGVCRCSNRISGNIVPVRTTSTSLQNNTIISSSSPSIAVTSNHRTVHTAASLTATATATANTSRDNAVDDDEIISIADILPSIINDNNKNNIPNQQIVKSFFDNNNKTNGRIHRDELYNEIHKQIYDNNNNNNNKKSNINNTTKSCSTMINFLQEVRRYLHQYPELMYQEEKTSGTIQYILNEANINYTTNCWGINTHPKRIKGNGGYGIVADIGTGNEPCILLRADMDGLPILEKEEHFISNDNTDATDNTKDRPPISKNHGNMHACGHDGHMTMLLGAAIILKQMESILPGTVRIMFQPAEEGGAGGKRMIEEGLLTKYPKPRIGFGLHVWPTIPSGSIAARPGPLLAAAERFEIHIEGIGGHAAMPHLTHDPIVAASAIIMNLQTVVSRNMSPLDSGVVSVTKMQAGDAYNIIPQTAILRGTIRALSTESLMHLRDRVHDIILSTASIHGCKNTTVTYSPDYYPPTVNDPELYDNFSRHVGAIVSDEGYIRDTEPTMAGEDFGFVAEQIPSTFFLLGQGSGTNPPTNYGLHHPQFALDESILPRGVELHVNLALRGLQRLLQQQQH